MLDLSSLNLSSFSASLAAHEAALRKLTDALIPPMARLHPDPGLTETIAGASRRWQSEIEGFTRRFVPLGSNPDGPRRAP
jgi:hypothetical protein